MESNFYTYKREAHPRYPAGGFELLGTRNLEFSAGRADFLYVWRYQRNLFVGFFYLQ